MPAASSLTAPYSSLPELPGPSQSSDGTKRNVLAGDPRICCTFPALSSLVTSFNETKLSSLKLCLSISVSSTMPDLPCELEREIFELAVISNRKDRLTLCLVARRVQHWVDLIYWKMVTIHRPNSPEAGRFLRFIQSNLKPPGFFAAVKILCLTYSRAAEDACGILAACTQVQRLGCWVDFGGHPDFPQLVSQLPLRRLSMEVNHFLRIPLTPSTWLSYLTHLELVAWHDYDAASLSVLAHFPRLTHVCVNAGFEGGREHAAVVCSSCPLLRVLIFVVNDLLASRSLAYDHRIVLQERLQNIVGDWEAPYFGLPDMWDRADAIVEEQRALTVTGNPGKILYHSAQVCREDSCGKC